MLTFILVALGVVLTVGGLVGCVLPVLPGPPLNWLGLLCLSMAYDWEPFSPLVLMVTAAVAVVVTILDFIVPAVGARNRSTGDRVSLDSFSHGR